MIQSIAPAYMVRKSRDDLFDEYLPVYYLKSQQNASYFQHLKAELKPIDQSMAQKK